MLVMILIFLVSLIPSVLIIVLLSRRRKDEPLYKKASHYALFGGLISVLPILVVSTVLFFTNRLLKATVLKGISDLAYDAIYTFVVLAFAEELVKFVVFRLLLKKKYYDYTWADVTAFMVIIGAAFGLIEDIPYAFGANPMEMIVRGVTMGHVGYGFVMGWFYGKRLYTGNKIYAVIAFVLPCLLHGIYDFSLSNSLWAVNDDFKFLGVGMAVLDLVLVALMIIFFLRTKKKERYNVPLFESAQ